MAFDKLTKTQKDLVIDIIEKLSSGLYEPEFMIIQLLAGPEIQLWGANGAETSIISNINMTDIRVLADEGYLALIPSARKQFSGSLRQKAFDEYKDIAVADSVILQGKTTDVVDHPIEMNSRSSSDDQLKRIADNSIDILNQLRENYKFQRDRAKQWTRLSMYGAIFGLFIIFIGIIALFIQQNTAQIITTSSGIITEFLSVTLFIQADKANKSQDNYHEMLINRQKLLDAVQLTTIISNQMERDHMTELIVKSLIGLGE
jgi:hypothetical protein